MSVAPHLAGGFHACLLASMLGLFLVWPLHRSCCDRRCHSHCEFICASALEVLENNFLNVTENF